jgi:hypothetical protein
MRPPVWTVTQAADAAGVSRSTIQRLLAAGDFPGATQEDTGRKRWLVPIPEVASHPDLDVSPPTDAVPQERLRQAAADPAAAVAYDEALAELAALRVRLATAEADARLHSALAEERATTIELLSQRLLTAGTPTVQPVPVAAPARTRKRGLAERFASAANELTR